MIELETESLKTNKNESEKFSINTWLAIPESPQHYQHINLLKTFEPNRSYRQAEIEENFSKLISECNEKLEEIQPNKEFEIAIEWILPSNLLSLDIDRWNYRGNTTIAGGNFRSVHVRSSQRLHTAYKHCRIKWQKKWEQLLNDLQQLNLSHYLLACQCNSRNENDLKICDNQKEILGINLPSDLQELENISYESIIDIGVPLALWSRCKQTNVNHINDLDTLINPKQENTLNLKNLPQSVQTKRLEADPNQPNHLGHHLCFLWENPYNYPKQKKLRFN